MSAVWPMVHAERAALIEDLEDLDAESWARPSMCGDWRRVRTDQQLP